MDLKHKFFKKNSAFGKAARIIAILLCASMAFPAAACKKKSGGKTGGQDQQNPSGGDDFNMKKADFVQESDPYYSDTAVRLEIPTDPKRTVSTIEADRCAFSKEGDALLLQYSIIYVFSEEEQKVIEDTNYSDPDQLLKYYEIQNKNAESGILVYSLDGKNTVNISLDTYETATNFTPLKDGRIVVFAFVVDPQSQQTSHKIIFFDRNGNRESELSCQDQPNLTLHELSNGNIVSLCGRNLSLIDKNGKALGAAKFENDEFDVFQIDGKDYLVSMTFDYLSEDVREHFYAQEIDPNNGELSEAKELPAPIPYGIHASNGKYYLVDDHIKSCDIMTGTIENVCRLEYTNVEFSKTENILVTSDGDIYTVDMYTDPTDLQPEAEIYLTHLHKEAKNPYAGKRIVYVGNCLEASYAVQSIICAYNRRPESKTRVYVYSQSEDLSFAQLADKSEAADKLLLDMKSGTGPDILLDCAELGHFNSEEILVDLNKYMDGKDPIDRTKFFDNVFRAFEVDGKLFQLPVFFAVEGFNGNPDLLGDVGKWTISDFDQKMGSLKDTAFPAIGYFNEGSDASERIGLLTGMLSADMGHYVDYSKNEANFDSDDFRKLLEISKNYGGRISDAEMGELRERFDAMDDHAIESLIMQAGVCALSTNSFSNLRNFSQYDDLCKGSSLFLGWPTASGSGLAAKATVSAGISAFSKCPEEAWDFVSFLLSPQIQNEFSNYGYACICVSRDGEKLAISKAREEYDKEKERMKEGIEEDYAWTCVIDDKTEQDYLRAIESVGASIHTDPAIMLIIEEEAAAYFSGAKDADSVSRSIQNRVKLLLQEKA